MILLDRLRTEIQTEEDLKLRKHALAENMTRGVFLAHLLIGFELLFALLDVAASLLDVRPVFSHGTYALMYLLMIFINIRFLLIAKRATAIDRMNARQVQKLEDHVLLYIITVMGWGSVMSLMDQALYGQTMVYMVNMIACSAFFYLGNRALAVPFAVSTGILFVGLPFFQHSADVLIGHYINSVVFIIICWSVSRIIYRNFCNDHKNRELLKKSNMLLEQEIYENSIINAKLSERNLHLKQLSLNDELTGIPNRRSFRNFIDIALDTYASEGCLFSVIMIDVDHFKKFNDQYGHGNGDKILTEIAQRINSVVEHSRDFAARWGGEEFIYASFGSSVKEITSIAEKIRTEVLAMGIPHAGSKPYKTITASLGVAIVGLDGNDAIARGIELADKALYQAKANGRNCLYVNEG